MANQKKPVKKLVKKTVKPNGVKKVVKVKKVGFANLSKENRSAIARLGGLARHGLTLNKRGKVVPIT